MQSTLTVLGVFVIGMALRSCRKPIFRKLGALVYLIVSGLVVYCITDCIWAAIIASLSWFLLPWIELLTRIRKLRLPLNNKLHHRCPPSCENFPDAAPTLRALEDAGFEHTLDSGWDWGSSTQFYRFFWHPEERAVAAVCLCEQQGITFSFLTITSRSPDGEIFRTTNYPFSQTLKNPTKIAINQIGCRKCPFKKSLSYHHDFIIEKGLQIPDLIMPCPDRIAEEVENDMREQIDHNIEKNIIALTGDGHFRYTTKGLFYLWFQFIKDMIHLC